MKLSNILFCGLSLGLTALCIGCKSHSEDVNPEVSRFDLNDFQTIDISGTATEINSDPEIIGVVKELCIVNDSIIAISQARSDNNVILYNIVTGQHQIANRRGAGPLELHNVGSLSTNSKGDLIITGAFDQKIISAHWNPDGYEALTSLLYKPIDNHIRAVAGPGDSIVALSSPTHRSRILILDDTGNPSDSLGTYPKVSLPNSVYPTNYMFQADIACSQGKGKIVIANKSWNEITIHSLKDKKDNITLSGPVFPELSIKSYGGDMGIGYATSPLWFMFSGVNASDEAFHVGYIGVEVKSNDDFSRQINSILEFDWNGKPQRRFILASEAMTFTVDNANNMLYTVEDRPDATLVQYKLAD